MVDDTLLLNTLKTMNDILEETEFLKGTNVLIIGKSGSGKTILCEEIACRHINKKTGSIWVTTDRPEKEVLTPLLKKTTKEAESHPENLIYIVNNFGKIFQRGNKPNLEYSASLRKAFEQSDVFELLIFDTISDLIVDLPETEVTKFIRQLFMNTKKLGIGAIFTIDSEIHSKSFLSWISHYSDAVIELECEDLGEENSRFLRIKKHKLHSHFEGWMPFTIDRDRRISIDFTSVFASKEPQTKDLDSKLYGK